jgi:delta1-piperideine-2-carboxylate reductase
MHSGDTVNLTPAEVHALAVRVLRANGCDEANAEAIAANMTRAERDEGHSHGLYRLPAHVTSLRNGKANGRAQPRIESLAPAILRVHGDGGYAPLAQAVGLPALIEAARAHGLAALAITRTIHFAALWPEVETVAEAGLAALAFTSSPPYVAPAGGRVPVFGTNPMAFGWPRAGAAPLVFDQASAARARGDVALAARAGEQVPEGTGVDAEGRPTTDPAAILAGAQLPFGGYKGAAIALMVDLLAGPLIGEVTSLEAGAADNGDGSAALGGELILAFDAGRLGGAAAAEGQAGAEALFATLSDQPGARLPGARRLAARSRTARDGVAIPADLHATLLSLAQG